MTVVVLAALDATPLAGIPLQIVPIDVQELTTVQVHVLLDWRLRGARPWPMRHLLDGQKKHPVASIQPSDSRTVRAQRIPQFPSPLGGVPSTDEPLHIELLALVYPIEVRKVVIMSVKQMHPANIMHLW